MLFICLCYIPSSKIFLKPVAKSQTKAMNIIPNEAYSEGNSSDVDSLTQGINLASFAFLL